MAKYTYRERLLLRRIATLENALRDARWELRTPHAIEKIDAVLALRRVA